MSPQPPPARKGPQISAAQVAGGALAAVSAAVVASFLGIGGTVIGAAIGSIVASVGGALYSHSFARAGDRLGETKVLTVVTRSRVAGAEPTPADLPVIEDPDGTGGDPPYAESGRDPSTEVELGDVPAIPSLGSGEGPARETSVGPFPPPGGRVPRWVSWKSAAILAVLAFVLALVAISVMELFLGRPISGGSSGTTISHVVNRGSSEPTPTPTSTPTPSSTSTATTPTSTATGTPTANPVSPSPTDTPTSPSPTSTAPAGATSAPTG